MVIFVSMQSALLKEYPNKMLVTVTQCVFSTVQSFVVAVVAERDFSKWKLRFNISLLAIIYTVIYNYFNFVCLLLFSYYLLFSFTKIKLKFSAYNHLWSLVRAVTGHGLTLILISYK